MPRPSPSALVLLFVLSVVIALVVSAGVLVRRESAAPPGMQRLLSVVSEEPEATIDEAITRSSWTEFADYGTVRIGRVERPARLFTGRKRWVRQVRVPPGGARYEAFVGATEAPIQVQLKATGAAPVEVSAPADGWTRISVDFDSSRGSSQSVAFDVKVPPAAVAAWGSETVTPLRRVDLPPDVVMISLDTVRRDQLTPYVPSLPTTPHLATFAGEAIRFDQAISTSSWTIGSHAALFTGTFPPDSLGYQSRVEPGERTLPEIFAAAGYRTFGVSGGPYTDPRWGLHQGFDEYIVSADRENAGDATSRAIEWMERAGGAPVFLFLNYFNAHEPLELSAEVQHLTGVTDGVPGSLWFELDSGTRPVTPGIREQLLRAYRAELRSIDQELGRLFDDLKRRNRWDRSAIIVWADHGQLLGERGHIGHAYTLEEELINVPLIVKPAGGRGQAPAVHPHLIQEDDLFAFTQSLAGIANAEGDQVAAAVNANRPVRRLAFSRIHHDPLPALMAQRRWRSATQWAVRTGDMKIVRDLEGRSFAYDIAGREERVVDLTTSDPWLVAALDRFRSWVARVPSARTIGPLSPAERERLRALGYIQ